MLRICAVALQLLLVVSESAHEHGEGAVFEWAGVFETPDNKYMWTAQKVRGSNGHPEYVEASMKMAALPASAATEEVLHAMESEGAHALGMNCTEVEPGGVIEPVEDKCYQLHFKQDLWQSLFTINAGAVNAIAFFTEHVPTEFENTAHYLKDEAGYEAEPMAQLPEAGEESESNNQKVPWGLAIGAAVIVNLVTLVGVIFLVPLFAKLTTSYAIEFEGLISGFAAGALSACAFFLLLFEATHLIAVGLEEEVEVIWRWGTMILTGFMVPGVIQVISGGVSSLAQGKAQSDGAPGEKHPGDAGKESLSERARVIGGVLIGDFFHNLCDGFFMGAAAKNCGHSFAWGVAGSTIAHELAQEVSDFFILTGSGKLRPVTALVLNFISGMSVLLGVLLVLAADIPDEHIGLILAFGGGVYLHIAATECMPKVYSPELSVRMRAASLSTFVLGATVIGLVLLDHQHCVLQASGAEATSGGHHH